MIGDAVITCLLNFAGFGLLVLLRREVHHEGLRSFHLHVDARGLRLFLGGAIAGAAGLAVYGAVVLLAGRGRFVVGTAGATGTAAVLAVWALGFLGVALVEEALFRGYLLDKVARRAPLWVAIVVPSALFGLVHLPKYAGNDAPWLGIVNAALFGVVLSMVVLVTGSLMPAVGFHWSWNVVETFLMPAGDRATRAMAHLEVQDRLWPHAPAVPESELAVTVFLILLGVVVAAWWRRAGVHAAGDTGRPSA